VNEDCTLKVADFGLARLYDENNENKILAMTEYVTTRWYRAPEIIVGWAKYTAAVDMWALGCILGELLGRTPMFPGTDSNKQLELISKVIGAPDEQFADQSKKPSYRFNINIALYLVYLINYILYIGNI
jgi:mitogen-activated protein kinase 15